MPDYRPDIDFQIVDHTYQSVTEIPEGELGLLITKHFNESSTERHLLAPLRPGELRKLADKIRTTLPN